MRKLLMALATLGLMVVPAVHVEAATVRPVVLIVFENHSYSQIATSAPYLNGLSHQGLLLTNHRALQHPSLPNYMAFTAGSNLGCTMDYNCTPNTKPQDNFYHQLEAAGISWGAYEEVMSSNCRLTDQGVKPNKYIAHHNPVVYFTDVHAACLTKVVPYSRLDVNNLPAFTWIGGSNAHNMHDGTIAQGDAWAASVIPPLIQAGATVVVTFDEGGRNLPNYVYTLIVGPDTTPGVSGQYYTHYSLLAGLEDHFGVSRLLNATTAVAMPI